MPSHYHERREGPIRGLRLPLTAWKSLQDEGITTLGQLMAVADRLEWLIGIGPKMAQVIREELARVAASKRQPANKRQV
jgi:predicted flap endonuclease-1-like 5' DNA nuclease